MKFRETECFAQGHTASQNQEFKSWLLTLNKVLISLCIASQWDRNVYLKTKSKLLCIGLLNSSSPFPSYCSSFLRNLQTFAIFLPISPPSLLLPARSFYTNKSNHVTALFNNFKCLPFFITSLSTPPAHPL